MAKNIDRFGFFLMWLMVACFITSAYYGIPAGLIVGAFGLAMWTLVESI